MSEVHVRWIKHEAANKWNPIARSLATDSFSWDGTECDVNKQVLTSQPYQLTAPALPVLPISTLRLLTFSHRTIPEEQCGDLPFPPKKPSMVLWLGLVAHGATALLPKASASARSHCLGPWDPFDSAPGSVGNNERLHQPTQVAMTLDKSTQDKFNMAQSCLLSIAHSLVNP